MRPKDLANYYLPHLVGESAAPVPCPCLPGPACFCQHAHPHQEEELVVTMDAPLHSLGARSLEQERRSNPHSLACLGLQAGAEPGPLAT